MYTMEVRMTEQEKLWVLVRVNVEIALEIMNTRSGEERTKKCLNRVIELLDTIGKLQEGDMAQSLSRELHRS